MNIACVFGSHQWKGCKCSVCGKCRGAEHTWDGCRCSVCGMTRDEEHDWTQDQEKCAMCGKTRTVCGVCGRELDPNDADKHRAKCIIYREISGLPKDAILLVNARLAERMLVGWSFGDTTRTNWARLAILEMYVSCVGRVHDDEQLVQLQTRIREEGQKSIPSAAMGLPADELRRHISLGLMTCDAKLLCAPVADEGLDREKTAEYMAGLVLSSGNLAAQSGVENYRDLWPELMSDLSAVVKIAKAHGWTRDSVVDLAALGDLVITPEQVLARVAIPDATP